MFYCDHNRADEYVVGAFVELYYRICVEQMFNLFVHFVCQVERDSSSFMLCRVFVFFISDLAICFFDFPMRLHKCGNCSIIFSLNEKSVFI